MIGGISVPDSSDRAGSRQPELDPVGGIRHQQSVLIEDLHRDKRQIATIRIDHRSVSRKLEFRGKTRGCDAVFRPLSTVFVCNNFQFSGLVRHIIPTQPVLEGSLFLPAERVAIKEQFGFIARGVHVDGSDFADAIRPVPMGKDVHHRHIGTPSGLIEIEAIFPEPAEVDDAEVRAARRRCVVIIRRRSQSKRIHPPQMDSCPVLRTRHLGWSPRAARRDHRNSPGNQRLPWPDRRLPGRSIRCDC